MSADVGEGSPQTTSVLDELQFLVTVEHALIVEYLSVCCALGHDLPPSDGGPLTPSARDAAVAAKGLAGSQMLRVAGLARALHRAGRVAGFGRARAVPDASGTQIPLAPPSREQLEEFPDREEMLAEVVDGHYVRLERSLAEDGSDAGSLPDQLRTLLRDGATHRQAVSVLRDSVGDQPVGPLLRATSAFGAATPQQVLSRISNRAYAQVVAALTAFYGDLDGSGGEFRLTALGAMDLLDDANRALVHVGLLPQFAMPPG